MPDILLVDDHSIVRTGLKLLIHDFLPHSDIDEANNGASAIKNIKQKNYDLKAKDADGLTALHYAAKFENPEVVELLIKYGANPNAGDFHNDTPLDVIAIRGSNPNGVKVASLLLQAGANINAQDDFGKTPLHLVQNLQIMRVLLKAGPDLSLRSKPYTSDSVQYAKETAFTTCVLNIYKANHNLNFYLAKNLNEMAKVLLFFTVKKRTDVEDFIKEFSAPKVSEKIFGDLKNTPVNFAQLLLKNWPKKDDILPKTLRPLKTFWLNNLNIDNDSSVTPEAKELYKQLPQS